MFRTIIYKLLAFTFAMITFPIGSYFLSVNTIFGGLSCPSIHSTLPPADLCQNTSNH